MTLHKIFLLVLSLCVLIISCTKKSEIERFRSLGTDALEVTALEEQSEALVHWVREGVKNAVLIHIDPHDSMGIVEGESVENIRAIVRDENREDPMKDRRELITNANYLHAAVQLGIINKMYWVIPYRLFEDIPLAKEKIQEFLRTSPSGFREEEISAMRMIEGCLTGFLAGVDIHICSPRTLPKVFIPALVSMDSSFLTVYAKGGNISKLRALKWVLDYLSFKQKLLVSHAYVSYGIKSGYTEPVHRYIGDQLIASLEDPQILKAESPPELWQFRDRAENMLSGGEDALVEEYLAEPLEKYPDDPALRLMHAAARLRLEKYDAAYAEADEVCSMDNHYCYGFLYLGTAADDRSWQQKFFERARETVPESELLKKTVSPETGMN